MNIVNNVDCLLHKARAKLMRTIKVENKEIAGTLVILYPPFLLSNRKATGQLVMFG